MVKCCSVHWKWNHWNLVDRGASVASINEKFPM